jgi:hypothetical protein
LQLALGTIGLLGTQAAELEAQYEPTVGWPCPLNYGFNTYFEFSARSGATTKTFYFLFGAGVFKGVVPNVGMYTFADILAAGGGAILRHPYVNVSCVAQYLTIPPYAEPQRVIFVLEENHGGELEVVYQRGPCDPEPLLQESGVKGKVWSGWAGEAESLCAGSDGGGEPSGGGGPGGGHWVTYCLYWDWYDGDGNYLYTELDHCWSEYVE